MTSSPESPMEAFPGIGPKSREMLQRAGITSLEKLHELGAPRAYVLVQAAGCRPTLNFLWGLESLITGQPWQMIARLHRTSLLLALEAAQQASSTGNSE